MNNIRRQLYYALSAAIVGIACAAFLVFLAKRISADMPSDLSSYFHRVSVHISAAAANKNKSNPIGLAENPALAQPLTQQQEQAFENLDEDAASSSQITTYSKAYTVTATQYLVIDLTNPPVPTATSTDQVIPFVLSSRTILEKDPERAVPIASLTKLVTAVVAQNILDQNTPITITQNILNTDGNTAGFRLGENFSAPELMYPLLMVSSNDAGEALAQATQQGRAGSNDPSINRADFIRSMNEWVESIGAYHTYFADPTGLSPENVSDADDLAIIMRWIYQNRPDLIAITQTKVKEFRTHTWTNPTQLLNLSSYLGGKNGYIPQSGETAVSLFQVGVKLFAVVVLGSSNRDQDILELMRESTGIPYITYEKPTKSVKQTAAAIDSRN